MNSLPTMKRWQIFESSESVKKNNKLGASYNPFCAFIENPFVKKKQTKQNNLLLIPDPLQLQNSRENSPSKMSFLLCGIWQWYFYLFFYSRRVAAVLII